MMPPHSSRPRRHLINGQSCPVRGPFILALGDARLPGRRAPHWADCASGSPSKLPGCWHTAAPWTLPRQHLVFFGFISSSGRQAPPPPRTLSQHRLDFPQTLALSTVYGEATNPPQQARPVASGKPWKQLQPRAGRGRLPPADAFPRRASGRRCPLRRRGNWGLEGGTRLSVRRALSFFLASRSPNWGHACTQAAMGSLPMARLGEATSCPTSPLINQLRPRAEQASTPPRLPRRTAETAPPGARSFLSGTRLPAQRGVAALATARAPPLT